MDGEKRIHRRTDCANFARSRDAHHRNSRPTAHQHDRFKCVKGLVASVLLEGSTHAERSHACLEEHLLKDLSPPSTFLNG
jgi:hypothetical protein